MTLNKIAHLTVAAASHPGLRGKTNEDRYSIQAHRPISDDHAESVLAIIADGIGGHRAGEVAAELAVRVINQYIRDNHTGQPGQILVQALRQASQVIFARARVDPTLTGMGTTCVCAWVIRDRLYAASVGDSRLYLQRGSKLLRLTTDHTWIQDALAQGTLTPEQAKGHPNSHIIRRFLGSANPIVPDLRIRLYQTETDEQAEANQGMQLLPGDVLLLSSDGLTDLVKDAEILEVLQVNPLENLPARLIDIANQRGGHDNITVIAMQIPRAAENTHPLEGKSKPGDTLAPKPQRSAASWVLVILLIIAITMMVLLLLFSGIR